MLGIFTCSRPILFYSLESVTHMAREKKRIDFMLIMKKCTTM